MRSPVETTEKSLHYYVINLPKSAKRREHMREVLGPLFPPPIRFFTAVAGAELSPAEKSAACVDMDLSDTELGCALSHQGVYKAMIQANEEYAFVFEDDIDREAMATKEALASCRDFILTRSSYCYYPASPRATVGTRRHGRCRHTRISRVSRCRSLRLYS